MKSDFIKRLVSFTWRLGAFVAVALINFVVDNSGLLELPDGFILIGGLVLGEVTKYLNNKYDLDGFR